MKTTISIIINSVEEKEPLDLFPETEDSFRHEIRIEYLYDTNLNQGILNASGDYIIFLDQHDTLLESGLKAIIQKALLHDSDIIIGAAYREDIGLIWNRDRLFKEEKINTNLNETPYLIYDSILSNKMFKRLFLMKNNITFTKDNKFNHQLFAIQSFSLSQKITVIPKITCRWSNRKKIKGKKSNRLNLIELEQRLLIIKEIDKIYRERLNSECIDVKNEMFLRKDLLVFLNDILYGDESHIESSLALIKEYIESIDEGIFTKLKAIDRLKYYLLKRDLIDELLQVLRFQKEFYTPVTVAISQRVYANFPFFMDEKYRIPKEVYDVTNEMQVVTELDSVKLNNGTLFVKGIAYLNYLDFRDKEGIEKQLIFRSRKTNEEYPFPLNNQRIDDRVIKRGNGYYYYLYAGFESEINLSHVLKRVEYECYDVFIHLKFNDITKEHYIFTISNGEAFVEFNKQLKYDLYTSNVGSPSLVNDVTINENDTIIFTGNGYVGFTDLDEDHYFIRNLLLHNKVTNETHRLGLHVNILDEEKLLEMNSGLFFKTNLEFLSYIPSRFNSGIWEFKVSTREADGFEIMAPVKTELFAYSEGSFQINNDNFYLSSFNTLDKDLLLNFYNKEQKKDLKLEQKLKKTNEQLEKVKRKLRYMEESFSWKITKPIRFIRKLLSKK
ncbi:glycosyltransferase [Neobacillus drentensis]|uniref:glycosyltransferase n=1 Tax=Neobacillus drentensis TaxID=220684 RepID=UPI002FFEE3D3